MGYKFTKKQLYGYSIMNWKMFREKLRNADNKRYCSFCYDSYSGCFKCRIARYICDDMSKGTGHTYKEISMLKEILFDKIGDIIDQLTNEYNEIK